MDENGFQWSLRGARRAAALTQETLAARSGVSRVTIARIESGAGGDVRSSTLQALCGALGLELRAQPRDEVRRAQLRLHRERERAHRIDLRRRHALLAARLLAAPRDEADALIDEARACVSRWERDGLCSHHYIDRWRERLIGAPKRVARALVAEDDWSDALLQNSPFGSALGPPAG